MAQSTPDTSRMNRRCVVCGAKYGPDVSICCTFTSVVAVQKEGVFTRRKRYFTLEGIELNEQELEALRKENAARRPAPAPLARPQPETSAAALIEGAAATTPVALRDLPVSAVEGLDGALLAAVIARVPGEATVESSAVTPVKSIRFYAVARHPRDVLAARGWLLRLTPEELEAAGGDANAGTTPAVTGGVWITVPPAPGGVEVLVHRPPLYELGDLRLSAEPEAQGFLSSPGLSHLRVAFPLAVRALRFRKLQPTASGATQAVGRLYPGIDHETTGERYIGRVFVTTSPASPEGQVSYSVAAEKVFWRPDGSHGQVVVEQG